MDGRRAFVATALVMTATLALATSEAREPDGGGIDLLDFEPVDIPFEDVPQTSSSTFQLGYEPESLGDLLVTYTRSTEELTSIEVVTSADLGASWQRVVLPGRPPVRGSEDLDQLDIESLGDVLTVSAEVRLEGSDGPTQLYLWTTSDGIQWRGGLLPTPEHTGRSAGVGDIWRGDDGYLYVHVFGDYSGHRDATLRSGDDGVSWEPFFCPAATVGCRNIDRSGQLWVRWVEGDFSMSLDEGATWADPALPGIDPDDLTGFDVVERADGGWLAVAMVSESDGSDGWDERYLIRSEDGFEWERVFDHDSRCWSGFPGEGISTPVPLGGRWLVSYTCSNPTDAAPDGPRLAQLHVLDGDGTNLRPIDGTMESASYYGQPIVVGDVALVAVVDFRTGSIVALRELEA